MPAQPVDDVEAADAVMAVDDECRVICFGLKFRKRGGDGAHGDQFAAFDASQRVFVRLADVDEVKFLAGVEAMADLVGSGFSQEHFSFYRAKAEH